MSINTLERRTCWRFSLRTLLITTVLIGCGVGLAAKSTMDYLSRPSTGRFDFGAREEALEKEFETTNPVSLDDWTVGSAGPQDQWLAWFKDGLAYFDRNGDGLPDKKSRVSPKLSTTEWWWEDTNFDGTFDTRLSRGCFHQDSEPLPKLIAVPSASNSATQTIRIVP